MLPGDAQNQSGPASRQAAPETCLVEVSAEQAYWLKAMADEPRSEEARAIDGPLARGAMRAVAEAFDLAPGPPLDWESRALAAEGLICRLLVYARPSREGGLSIPRFLASDAERLVPDWRERRKKASADKQEHLGQDSARGCAA